MWQFRPPGLAVVRLASRPRNTTVMGAPAIALKLGQLAVRNLGAAVMIGFIDSWSDNAEAGEDTPGAPFDAPCRRAASTDGGVVPTIDARRPLRPVL